MRKLLERILEQDDIFRPATPEEIKQRKAKYKDIRRKEWVENFLKRDDVHKNEDGSYDVDEAKASVKQVMDEFDNALSEAIRAALKARNILSRTDLEEAAGLMADINFSLIKLSDNARDVLAKIPTKDYK